MAALKLAAERVKTRTLHEAARMNIPAL